MLSLSFFLSFLSFLSFKAFLAKTPGELRDIGALLNMEFESNIKRLSLQRGAGLAQMVAPKSLMGVAEEAEPAQAASARPLSMMMPGDAKLDGIEGK